MLVLSAITTSSFSLLFLQSCILLFLQLCLHSEVLQRAALHYITLHYITLHYREQHYICLVTRLSGLCQFYATVWVIKTILAFRVLQPIWFCLFTSPSAQCLLLPTKRAGTIQTFKSRWYITSHISSPVLNYRCPKDDNPLLNTLLHFGQLFLGHPD